MKEAAFIEAAKEYEKRLGAFCKLETIEIKPCLLPESPSPAEISAALLKEAEKIALKIPEGAAVYPLCIEGAKVSSETFATEIGARANEGKPLCFIIGSSHGLHADIKKLGKKLSFSDMTFPHRLFRVMLLEQLYRAFSIINGGKYHK